MKRIKQFICLLFAAACTACFAGCGANITAAALPPDVVLACGETLALSASYQTEREASPEAIVRAIEALSPVWSSSNEVVATVDEDGNVTAQSAGDAVITLTVKEGVTATCRVTVYVPLEDLHTPAHISLVLNLTENTPLEAVFVPYDATDVTLTYTSDNEAVASVDSKGIIHAVGAGECVVTTHAAAGIGADNAVKERETTVKVDVAPVRITAADLTLTAGDSAPLDVAAEGESITVGTMFRYEIADEAIATVDKSGTVAAIGVGETEITVTNDTGQCCTAKVTVIAPSGTRARPANSSSGASSVSQMPAESIGGAQSAAPTAPTEAGTAPAQTQPIPRPEGCRFCLWDETTGTLVSAATFCPLHGIDCPVCGGHGHTDNTCPNTPVSHYHGNGTDSGNCPACGIEYSPNIIIPYPDDYWDDGMFGGE